MDICFIITLIDSTYGEINIGKCFLKKIYSTQINDHGYVL